MEKIFFANKIIQTSEFSRYAKYYSDQLGCHVNNLCFLDRRIYAFKSFGGSLFVDDDNNTLIEITPFGTYEEVIPCWNCKYGHEKPFSRDCDKYPDSKTKCVGVANVSLITNLFRDYNLDDAIKIINHYNNLLSEPLVLIGNSEKEYNKIINSSNNKIRRYLRKNK